MLKSSRKKLLDKDWLILLLRDSETKIITISQWTTKHASCSFNCRGFWLNVVWNDSFFFILFKSYWKTSNRIRTTYIRKTQECLDHYPQKKKHNQIQLLLHFLILIVSLKWLSYFPSIYSDWKYRGALQRSECRCRESRRAACYWPNVKTKRWELRKMHTVKSELELLLFIYFIKSVYNGRGKIWTPSKKY